VKHKTSPRTPRTPIRHLLQCSHVGEAVENAARGGQNPIRVLATAAMIDGAPE
jgi:hypothetical protein